MDYLAHGLWSYIVFHKIKKVWYAVFFGLLPDNLSWAVYLIYSLFTNGFNFGAPVVSEIPNWVFALYNVSHSLIVASFFIILFGFIYKKIIVYMLAWPMAILMDVISHTRDFLPTPFLWPLTDWKFDGVRWGSPKFMIINYVLITIGLIYVLLRKRESYKRM